jgi:uncharacterized membrane protein
LSEGLIAPTSPRYEGMSGEGSDMSRIISLSDGVFAFSMTLLVINLALPAVTQSGSVPPLASYLSSLESRLLDYALAFIVVASWWGEHHRLFSAIRRYDYTLMRLNTYFLLLISVTPFILALVFSYGPDSVFDRSTSAIVAVGLFGIVEAVTGLLLFAIWRHATRDRRLVDPDLPEAWVKGAESQSLRRIGIFAVSVLVGIALPLVGELIWLGTLFGRVARRRPFPPADSPRDKGPAAR